jgi:hypothetical protein
VETVSTIVFVAANSDLLLGHDFYNTVAQKLTQLTQEYSNNLVFYTNFAEVAD